MYTFSNIFLYLENINKYEICRVGFLPLEKKIYVENIDQSIKGISVFSASQLPASLFFYVQNFPKQNCLFFLFFLYFLFHIFLLHKQINSYTTFSIKSFPPFLSFLHFLSFLLFVCAMANWVQGEKHHLKMNKFSNGGSKSL